jgi:hypothetical protein
VIPQGLDVLFPFVPFGDFRSPFLAIFLERFRGLSLWDLVGGVCMSFMVLFPLIPLPNPRAKELDFGVFGVLGLEEFLARFLRLLLIQQVLVDSNLAMELSVF